MANEALRPASLISQAGRVKRFASVKGESFELGKRFLRLMADRAGALKRFIARLFYFPLLGKTEALQSGTQP